MSIEVAMSNIIIIILLKALNDKSCFDCIRLHILLNIEHSRILAYTTDLFYSTIYCDYEKTNNGK